jgi:hypothetical protein
MVRVPFLGVVVSEMDGNGPCDRQADAGNEESDRNDKNGSVQVLSSLGETAGIGYRAPPAARRADGLGGSRTTDAAQEVRTESHCGLRRVVSGKFSIAIAVWQQVFCELHPRSKRYRMERMTSATTGRKPDLVLKCMDKVSGQKSGKIGAAWINKDGSITLVVDFPQKVEANAAMVYTLFANDAP